MKKALLQLFQSDKVEDYLNYYAIDCYEEKLQILEFLVDYKKTEIWTKFIDAVIKHPEHKAIIFFKTNYINDIMVLHNITQNITSGILHIMIPGQEGINPAIISDIGTLKEELRV